MVQKQYCRNCSFYFAEENCQVNTAFARCGVLHGVQHLRQIKAGAPLQIVTNRNPPFKQRWKIVPQVMVHDCYRTVWSRCQEGENGGGGGILFSHLIIIGCEGRLAWRQPELSLTSHTAAYPVNCPHTHTQLATVPWHVTSTLLQETRCPPACGFPMKSRRDSTAFWSICSARWGRRNLKRPESPCFYLNPVLWGLWTSLLPAIFLFFYFYDRAASSALFTLSMAGRGGDLWGSRCRLCPVEQVLLLCIHRGLVGKCNVERARVHPPPSATSGGLRHQHAERRGGGSGLWANQVLHACEGTARYISDHACLNMFEFTVCMFSTGSLASSHRPKSIVRG